MPPALPRPPEAMVLVLEAVSFAARAHRHQVRKDGLTPYVAHPFRVCLVVRHVFGLDDPELLATAILHDTIEDTTTDFDDLEEVFGARVARWVGTLSKDTRLPDEERERKYMADLAVAEDAVKISKLADIYDNLTDSRHLPPAKQARTWERSNRYLDALGCDETEAVRRPLQIVRELLAKLESQAAS